MDGRSDGEFGRRGVARVGAGGIAKEPRDTLLGGGCCGFDDDKMVLLEVLGDCRPDSKTSGFLAPQI